MNDDHQHLRMQVGETAMVLGDCINDEFLQAMREVTDASERFARLIQTTPLADHDQDATVSAVIAAAMNGLRRADT